MDFLKNKRRNIKDSKEKERNQIEKVIKKESNNKYKVKILIRMLIKLLIMMC